MNAWLLYRVLCRLLGADDPRVDCAEISADGQWPPLLELAATEQVSAWLAAELLQSGELSGLIPGGVERQLRDTLRVSTAHNMAIMQQALQVSDLLNAAEIEPLFFKGAAGLLDSLYPNLGSRSLIDIDFMVPPDQVATALEVLGEAGYRYGTVENRDHQQRIRAVDSEAELRYTTELYRYHHHLPPLVKPGAAVSLELHRHCLAQRFQSRLPLAELFARSRSVNRGGASFRVPHPVHACACLVLGSFVNDGSRGCYSFPLRQAMDIALLRRSLTAAELEELETLCAPWYGLYTGLLDCLVGGAASADTSAAVRRYLGLMRAGRSSAAAASLLHIQGRARRALDVLLHDPRRMRRFLLRPPAAERSP